MVNAVSSGVSLLNGLDGTAQPNYASKAYNEEARLGVTAAFTVNASDLIAGNTIVIAVIRQTSTDPTGAKATLSEWGGRVALTDNNGNQVGTVGFDPSLQCITLAVTQTSGGMGTEVFNVSGQWVMDLNFGTPADVRRKMPFNNTIDVYSLNNNTPLPTPQSYTFAFSSAPATTTITQLAQNAFGYVTYTEHTDIADVRFSERIANNTVLQQLQSSGGQTGTIKQDDLKLNFLLTSNTQDLIPQSSPLVLCSDYVSAASRTIQSWPGSATTGYDSSACSTKWIPWTNGGDNQSAATLRQLADNSGTSAYYYSRLSKGNYRLAINLKYADTLLTDAQIETNTRNSPSAAAPNSNIEADVQATLNYYHGALRNAATLIAQNYRFGFSDPYTLTKLSIVATDTAGTIIGNTISDNNQIQTVAASGQTVVKSHYVGTDGQPLSAVTATAGDPTGKANSITGVKGTASAPATPTNVAGYRPLTVADLSSLTAAQRQTIASTLGTTDSSVAGLTALANKNSGKTVWATGNLTVPYPGETGRSYNANGDIVAAGTAGSTAGWGTTDVYYFYTLATQKLNVHVITVPCYTNSADASSGKDCDATPSNGSSWQPSDGVENTGLGETFTGLSGIAATNILSKYSVQLGGHAHAAELSAGLTQLTPGTDSKRTITFQLNTTYDMDNNTDQDEYLYIQANPEKDISKKTVRTIHYKLNHNTVDTPPADVTQTVTWTQHQIHNTAYDSIDGSPNWSKYVWQASSANTPATTMPKVNSPNVSGYIAKTPVVSEITGIKHDGTTDNPSVTFAPTDPANPDTSDRSLTVNVVYNKTVQRMPFTGGSGILLGTLIALGLLTMAAILTHLRNKRTTK